MKSRLLEILARIIQARFPCTAALAAGLFVSGCEKPELAEIEEKAAEPTPERPVDLPIRRTITDTSGRELRVDIIGRDSQSITVERTLDEQRFEIPIGNLSAPDAEFAATLPYVSPPPEKIAKTEETKEEVTDPEIRILNRRIDEANEELKKLDEEARTLEVGTIKYRSIRSDMDSLRKDIREWGDRIDKIDR